MKYPAHGMSSNQSIINPEFLFTLNHVFLYLITLWKYLFPLFRNPNLIFFFKNCASGYVDAHFTKTGSETSMKININSSFPDTCASGWRTSSRGCSVVSTMTTNRRTFSSTLTGKIYFLKGKIIHYSKDKFGLHINSGLFLILANSVLGRNCKKK